MDLCTFLNSMDQRNDCENRAYVLMLQTVIDLIGVKSLRELPISAEELLVFSANFKMLTTELARNRSATKNYSIASNRFRSHTTYCSYICDKVIELSFDDHVKYIECPVCLDDKRCLYTECSNKHAICFECQMQVGNGCPMCRAVSDGIKLMEAKRAPLIALLNKRVTASFVKNNNEVLKKLESALFKVTGVLPTKVSTLDNSHFSRLCNMVCRVKAMRADKAIC